MQHSAALKVEISELIAKKFLFEIVSRRNMCDRKQDLQIIIWAVDAPQGTHTSSMTV